MVYTCDLCQYTTTKQYSYNRHLDSQKHRDKQTGVKKNFCEICQIQFAFRSGLARHMHKHTASVEPQGELTKIDFIKQFQTTNPETARRNYDELSKYFKDNKLPVNWKEVFTSRVNQLNAYSLTLNPSSRKRFLQAVSTTIPELKQILKPFWTDACTKENEYLRSKPKPEMKEVKLVPKPPVVIPQIEPKPKRTKKPSPAYVNKLTTIIKELYNQQPFRFKEVWTAKVKRIGDIRDFCGTNYYDMNIGTFYIGDDKVKKFYSDTAIKFTDHLVELLKDWFDNLNKTENFLTSMKGNPLTKDTYRYLLRLLNIEPTENRKIYANEHKDDIDACKVMRHNMQTHITSYKNQKMT